MMIDDQVDVNADVLIVDHSEKCFRASLILKLKHLFDIFRSRSPSHEERRSPKRRHRRSRSHSRSKKESKRKHHSSSSRSPAGDKK